MTISKFDQWFEANRDELVELLRGDQEEALFRAWLHGYESGLSEMSKTVNDLSWYKSPDRSGEQFTDEEIDRSERGGEGW